MAPTDQLDELIPLGRVPDLLPPGPHGKRPHVSAVFRWVQRGIRGVRLRAVQAAGRRCTTRRWISEFFAALSEATGLPTAQPRSPAARKRSHEQADRVLTEAGL
jgi:hypothetical protein